MNINLDNVKSFGELWETELKQLLPDFMMVNEFAYDGFDYEVTIRAKQPTTVQLEEYERMQNVTGNGKAQIEQFPHLFHHYLADTPLCMLCTGWMLMFVENCTGDVMIVLQSVSTFKGNEYPTQIPYSDDLTQEELFKTAKKSRALKKMIEELIGMQEEINQLRETGRVK